MEITLRNGETIKGKKYLEILWNDTGSIVFRTEMNRGRLTMIWVNGISRTFDVPAQIAGDRMLVPVRHLESLACEVEWVSKTRSVIIYYNTGK